MRGRDVGPAERAGGGGRAAIAAGSTLHGARPRRLAASLAASVGAALAVARCAPPAARTDTAVYASGADLDSPNPLLTVHPLSRQVQRHALLVTLVRYDSALAPRPYYARRWAWGDGGRTLTLTLEPQLRWHDGAPTTAHDAVFTLDAARDPRVGFARAADLAALREARAADDTTLVLRFAGPQAALPAVLAELPLAPRHLLDTVPRGALRGAAFERAPVGNGPFRFAARAAGQRWTFARNDAFPASMGGPPRLARLVVAVVDEPTTKFAALVSGEVDGAGIAPTMATLAARDPALRVVSYPVSFATALVFAPDHPPFDDARVRQAVHLAVDRRRIVEAALAGYATPSASPIPPESPWAPPAAARGLAPDPARADALLDAAGWRRGADGVRRRAGRALDVTLLTVGSGDNPVEQLLQADLAARGVRVRIRSRELGAFLAAARAPRRSWDLLLAGIPGDVALSQLPAMFATASRGGALDYAGWHAPPLDAAFARAADAPTLDARRAAWADVARVLGDSAPATWLYHARGVQGLSRRLRGVTMDLRGEFATLRDWWLAPAGAG